MKRVLGFWSATALVVASMIGTGVFTTSGFLIRDLGSRGQVLAVWFLGGCVAMLGALSYGALARRIPESGGEYLFLSKTLHPAAGYVAGWVSLLAGFSAPLAAVAYGFGEYAEVWIPGFSPLITGTALLFGFAVVHCAGVKGGAWVQNGSVLLKVLLIGLFIVLGLALIPELSRADPAPFDAPTLAVSIVWVFFSYCGWNGAVYVGGEIDRPERNLPRALILGTSVVTVLYIGLNAVFLWSADAEALAGELAVGRIAARALGGVPLELAMTALILLALATSASALLMTGPRVYARMAHDGYLPSLLATPAGPPRAAILLQMLLALAFLWTSSYESLLTYIGFTLGLSNAATVWGLMRLRWREGPDLAVPGWPWIPALFILLILAISCYAAWQKPWESGIGLGTLALGVLAWSRTSRPPKIAAGNP